MTDPKRLAEIRAMYTLSHKLTGHEMSDDERERYREFWKKYAFIDVTGVLLAHIEHLESKLMVAVEALGSAADSICMDRCQHVIGHDSRCQDAEQALAKLKETP